MMTYKPTFNILILLILPFLCYAQQRENLRKIIASKYSIEIRQQKLDSFFLKESEKMSPKVLADCYHDYSARWCYMIKWEQEGNNSFLEKGIVYAKKAVYLRKKLDTINYKDLKYSLYNLAFFNYLNNNHFDATTIYLELIAIGHNDRKTMEGYQGLGYAYTEIGDFYKALDSFEKVISFCKNNTLQSRLLVNTYIDRATTYSAMGYKEFSKEIQINLFRADSVMKNANLQSEFNKSRIRQIEGNRLLKTGNYKDAIPFFKENLKKLSDNDSSSLAIVYNSLALSQLKLLDYKNALSNAEKATLYDPNYNSPYENLGDYYINNNEFEQGLLNYQKAIVFAIDKNKPIRYNDTISIKVLELVAKKDELLNHLISKANGWVQYFRHDHNKDHLLQALRTFKLADQLVDLIRFESTEYKSKLFWREKGASLYMKAVEVCYLLNKPTEAYYFMEKNKALLLLEDITNEQAKENVKLPNHIAKREFELKRNIHLSENKLQNTINEPKDTIVVLRDKIYENKLVYEKFVDSLLIAFPEYAVTKKKVTVLPYNTFKKKNNTDKEVVLQYILNKDQGFGLLTSTTGSSLFTINKIDQLHTDIVTQHKQLSQLFSNQDQLDTYQKVSYRIFKKLIPKDIYEVIKKKRLTIVPDYTLQQLSFETLVTTNDTLKYLIEDTEIRYAYSMSYLDRKQQIKHNPNNRFLGFAPVTFNLPGLGELSSSKEEINRIENIYSGKALLYKQATKANFLDMVNDYSIIHLSTHADVGDTANPWIAFTDAKIYLNEIYATKNQSDMVVLSACKTSLGELKKGEGIMSLARGFFHSGTKSVVSSLWPANDKANLELMVDFYKNMDQGLIKSAALRNAKLNYINSHTGSEQSPFYWGSLILIGDNAPLTLSYDFSKWYWIGLLFILILMAFLHRLRK